MKIVQEFALAGKDGSTRGNVRLPQDKFMRIAAGLRDKFWSNDPLSKWTNHSPFSVLHHPSAPAVESGRIFKLRRHDPFKIAIDKTKSPRSKADVCHQEPLGPILR